MSTLASLKLVASKKAKQATPVVLRRNKLAAKLNEQIELAQAQKEGRPYAPKRIKTLVNAETGERRNDPHNTRQYEGQYPMHSAVAEAAAKIQKQ